MAAGALGFLLMEAEPVAGCKRLVVQARELRHVGRSRWRWVVQEVTQDPRPALDRTTLDTITTHGEDGCRAKQASTGGIIGQRHLAEVIPVHSIDSVISAEQAIDHDVITLQ